MHSGVVSTRWVNYHDPYFILLAQLPRVVRAGFKIRETRRTGLEPDVADIAQLRQKATRLRTEYVCWYEGAVAGGAIILPVEVPSSEATSPFQSVFQHSNPWDGSILMNYWSAMLIIQECLDQCEIVTDRHFADSNRELATDILRSLEYVGHGLMGPYRVGVSSAWLNASTLVAASPQLSYRSVLKLI